MLSTQPQDGVKLRKNLLIIGGQKMTKPERNGFSARELIIFKCEKQTESDTIAFGAKLASILKRRDVIALEGPLGSGKTVLARSIIQHLCGKAIAVPSPTFTLTQIYEAPQFPIWHCDLYRLNDPDEAFELGLDEAFEDALTLIEWPSRLNDHLPKRRLRLKLENGKPNDERRIILDGIVEWQTRLRKLQVYDFP